MARVRVSPGVYRDDGKPSKGNGIAAKPPAARKKGAAKPSTLRGLTEQQNQAIDLRNQADVGLSSQANQMLPGVYDAYSQPFDYSQLPKSPWEQYGDVRGMATDYQNQIMAQFEADMGKDFAQESQDFEQMASNRGWAPGSEVYQKEKDRMEKRQDQARQSARTQALQQSDSYASNWNTMQTGNWQNAYGFANDKRNRPLSEFNSVYGSVSGMPMQNLGYSQASDLAQQGFANDRWMMKNTPRGGGGGGGGSQPLYAQYGFSSPLEMDAYKTAQARENAQWEWANNPQYRQPKQPSGGSILGGQALGTGLGILGMWAGNQWG